MPEQITSTLNQIAHSHPNPSLFSEGIALALSSILEGSSKKFKFNKRSNKLHVQATDKTFKDTFVCLGVIDPPLDLSDNCMLSYDPLTRLKRPAYSHEAQRVALYIGNDSEFIGPVFKDTHDMGIIIYLSGLNNINIEEVASLILEYLEIYKSGKRGFYTYWHGQEKPNHHQPVWPIGLVDIEHGR